MAVNKYIIIRNSTEQAQHVQNPETFHGKKFRVTHNGFQPHLYKPQEISETIGGKIDLSAGPVFYRWQGVIRTEHTLATVDENNNYGDLDDLRTYFKLNNPNGSPTNVITLVDHEGTAHTGFLSGPNDSFSPEALTSIIDGQHAHFFIPIQFIEKDAVS